LLLAILEQLQPLIEANGTAIHERPDTRDRAADDLPAHVNLLMSGRQADFDVRPRQQAQRRIDERTTRRNIDETRVVSGHDTSRQDAVIVDAAPAPVTASVGRRATHSGLHRFVVASNLSTRVRAVSL
jgi:hypothetical protein